MGLHRKKRCQGPQLASHQCPPRPAPSVTPAPSPLAHPTSLAKSSRPMTAECTTDSAKPGPPAPHRFLRAARRRCNSRGSSPSTGMVAQLPPTPTLLPPRPLPPPVAPACTLSYWFQLKPAQLLEL